MDAIAPGESICNEILNIGVREAKSIFIPFTSQNDKEMFHTTVLLLQWISMALYGLVFFIVDAMSRFLSSGYDTYNIEISQIIAYTTFKIGTSILTGFTQLATIFIIIGWNQAQVGEFTFLMENTSLLVLLCTSIFLLNECISSSITTLYRTNLSSMHFSAIAILVAYPKTLACIEGSPGVVQNMAVFALFLISITAYVPLLQYLLLQVFCIVYIIYYVQVDDIGMQSVYDKYQSIFPSPIFWFFTVAVIELLCLIFYFIYKQKKACARDEKLKHKK
jgi:hypothetical protein